MYRKIILLYHQLNRAHKRKIQFIIILTVAGALLEMLSLGLVYIVLNIAVIGEIPKFLIELLSNYRLPDNRHVAIYAIAFLSGFLIFKNIMLIFFTYHLYRLLSDIRLYVSNRLFRGYIDLDYTFFINKNSSEIIKNLTSLLSNFNHYFLNSIGMLFTEFFVIISILGLSLTIKPIDSAILFIMIVVPSLLYFKFTKIRISSYGKINLENETLRIKVANEMIGSIREIKLLDKSTYFIDNFNIYSDLSSKAYSRLNFISQSNKYFLESALILAMAVLIIIRFIVETPFTSFIPLLGFYAITGFKIIPSISRFISALQNLKFSGSTIDTLNQAFKLHENIISPKYTNKTLPFFKESIKIEKVAFQYEPDLPYIFKHINLEIKKGEAVGICGETGSGKSTLLNLVLGFLNPTLGTIKIDGHNIHQEKIALKSIIGYVPQDIFLLDDSIANNVAIGEKSSLLDRNRVRWALKEAQMEDLIKKQKAEIDSQVGERGIRISGGQKQRLGIARALYFGAKILIFDEATSALDQETEQMVMNNIAKLKNKYTLIVVAHRLSTLKVCDRIYKLSSNRLVLTELD